MTPDMRRMEQSVVLAYALVLLAVVLCARGHVFPGTGEAFSGNLFDHPYRLSMAVSGMVLAVFLGVASAWIGTTRRSHRTGLVVLAAGGLATGIALSFSPAVLYPSDQYPVSFGWLVGGAPVATATWLVGTAGVSRRRV